jgi:HK97 family phage major capsid protein
VEQKELIQTLDNIKSEIAKENAKAIEAVKDGATKEAAAINEKISSLKEAAEANQKALDTLIAERKNIQVTPQIKSINEVIAENVTKGVKETNWKDRGANFSFDMKAFDVKAAASMSTANYSGGTVGLSSWDSGFALVARRSPFLRQIMSTRAISSKYVAWVEQANRDGGAGQTAEGAAKTQADFDLVESNKVVEKITAYSKVTKEMLDDISFVQGEINNDLRSLVELKLDTDLFGGSGTTPALKGINTYATTFAAPTGLALAIDNANELDCLRAAMAQIELAYFNPNYILVHPADLARIDSLKDSQNNYIAHQAAGQWMFRSFYGIPVISNAGVTQGNFLVGDFTKSNLGIREDINISIGYDQDDFTKNFVTILAEVRAVHYVKSNHTTAFVKGAYATVKAALETA